MTQTQTETMKPRLTVKELKALHWEIVNTEAVESQLDSYSDDCADETGEPTIRYASAVYGTMTLRAAQQGITIVFGWQASAQGTYIDSYSFEVERNLNDHIEMSGATLVDDDDEVETGDAQQGALSEVLSTVLWDMNWEDRVGEELPVPSEIDVDNNKERKDMDKENTTIVYRDNGPAFRFTGELIARVASSANNASSAYLGRTGRWCELKLYRTQGGKYVCSQVGRTQWHGEHDRYSAAVAATEAEVIEFFGHGWLAKDLYEEAGIDATELVA